MSKSHDVNTGLVMLTVLCGLLRACGQGSFKAICDQANKDYSRAYVPALLAVLMTGLGYVLAGCCLRLINKQRENAKPVARDFAISGLNVFLGTVLQSLVVYAFILGANLGGSEYIGQWLAILIVVLFSHFVQKRHHSNLHLLLIILIIFGSSYYVINDRTVAAEKVAPFWMLICLLCSALSGFCMATYSWWLDKNPLGYGTAMIITGTWCIVFTSIAIIVGYLSGFYASFKIPMNPEYWTYALLTVFFWVTGGILATIVCINGLLNGIRQSVTTGSLMIGVMLISAIGFREFPTIEQLPGIVLIVGSIFMMSRCKQTKEGS